MKPTGIICFGELLWDMLPNAKVAGGAPFNIVNRANALSGNATVISSVGDDELGVELLELVRSKGNPTQFIQVHQSLPTSVVNILVGEGGEPHYDIVRPVAWDDILITEEIIALVKSSEAFIYSSLGLRSALSREALFQLLEHASLKVCDINLREGHYMQSTIERMLDHADILRMNETELAMVSSWKGITAADIEQQLQIIRDFYDYDTIIVTLGSRGAISYRDGVFYHQPVFSVTVIDTVGSGDAFLASYVVKRLAGTPEAESLKFACAVGALTASKAGGTPDIGLAEIEGMLA